MPDGQPILIKRRELIELYLVGRVQQVLLLDALQIPLREHVLDWNLYAWKYYIMVRTPEEGVFDEVSHVVGIGWLLLEYSKHILLN